MMKIKGKYTQADIFTNIIDDQAIGQIRKMVDHPAFTNPIKIMPDVHGGIGSVIGFTMKATDKIIPNVIGVDIGCGVLSYIFQANTSINEGFLITLDKIIKNIIPFGNDVCGNNTGKTRINEFLKFFESNSPSFTKVLHHFLSHLLKNRNDLSKYLNNLSYYFTESYLKQLAEKVGISWEYFSNSLGSLGSGNHFIEIGHLENELCLTIHSGSRNFGLRVCNYWQNIAQKDCGRNSSLLSNGESKNIEKDLAFLYETGNIVGYLIDMFIAQKYAEYNRRSMANEIIKILGQADFRKVESVHNYLDFNDGIIRKGAIRAGDKEPVVIPFNMRDGLIIGVGIGNEQWNFSAPHGAGRVLSRHEAKKKLSMEEFKKVMNGIITTSVCFSTLDESPMAYKPKEVIIEALKDVVKIESFYKPLLNIKGS
jgi:RNA-splicing ligase RtcB